MTGATTLAQKDPTDVVEYTVTLLGIAPDTISGVGYTPAGVTIPGSPAPSYTDDTFTFWVTGGTNGEDATVRAVVTTAGGRVYGRTFVIPVRPL